MVGDKVVRRAVTGLAVRQVRWGAGVVASVAGGMSVLVVVTYRGMLGDDVGGGVGGAEFAALAAKPAVRTLFGTPVALDEAGGFAVWRTGTPLAVLVAAWALVTATRVTRGEEGAGRWDLLLAGRTTVADVVVRHIWALAGGAVLTGAAVSVALAASGTSVRGAVLFGCGLALVGVFFAGTGAACAQVFPSRSAATAAATAVLGLGLLARMLGDGVAALSGLRWASPFGLLAISRPFAGNRWEPVILLAVAAAATVTGAAALARRRDAGAGLFTVRQVRTSRPRLTGSVGAFAVRSAAGVTLGWALAVAAYFVLIGGLAGPMTGFVAANPRFAEFAAQAGFTGLDRIDGYVAALSALLAVAVGMYTVIRIAALAEEETSRRLTPLLATPVTRDRILAAHAVTGAGGAIVLVTVAAVAAWAGGAATGADLALGTALAATGNVLPVALVSLAGAILALGTAPRLVALIGAVPTAGGFLLRALATAFDSPDWVAALSPFSHLAPVPLVTPNWPAGAVMLLIAAAVAAVGARAYRRRDIRA